MTTQTAERVQITLPPLHKNQQLIAKHPARFKVVCCGRRWGKTLLAMTLCIRDALKGKRIWHVAPTYKQTLEGWSYLQRLVQQLPVGIATTKTSELQVNFAGGGSIQLRTADNPDNLRGSGLDGVVIDEAATVKQEAWDLVLRPALADRQGWALFISTPQHFNWFWELYQRGEDPEAIDWASWQMPTWDNPYIAESEIEAAQRDMEPGDFDQEFGASFTAIGGAVFPLLSVNRPTYLRPMPDSIDLRRKGIGLDWGTTKEHNAAVVGGGIMAAGAVWITSAWLSDTGSANDWFDEARRVRTTNRASFARVDRSQSSAVDTLAAMGYEADKGIADVEARIGALQGLVRRQSVFFDSRDPGVRTLYQHLCEYHRDPETGKPVEERDDDVDACLYLVNDLVTPHFNAPQMGRAVRQAPARPVAPRSTVVRVG
jgi:hypothetical protein